MSTAKNRYLIEWCSEEVAENGIRTFDVVVCNDLDPVVMPGDSPYIGLSLDDLEKIVTTDDEYTDIERARLLKQIKEFRVKDGQ